METIFPVPGWGKRSRFANAVRCPVHRIAFAMRVVIFRRQIVPAIPTAGSEAHTTESYYL